MVKTMLLEILVISKSLKGVVRRSHVIIFKGFNVGLELGRGMIRWFMLTAT